MTSDARRVPIRPRVGVFSVFEAVDYKAWFALAEFVDNSIQSRLDQATNGNAPQLTAADPLHIDIGVEGGDEPQISIRDDAGGIPLERFSRAFEIGSPPPDPSGLSVYGIGMKSAAAWFGRNFEITTTCKGEAVARRVTYDFPTIIASGIEELDVIEFPAAPETHGTTVLLTGLKHPIQSSTHTKVRDHLTSIYRNFIRTEQVHLTYRGELVTYDDPDVLEAPWFRDPDGPTLVWRKNISLELSSGEQVHGFAAIRKTGRAAGSGFSLYREGRVITGLDDDPWRPTAIFGYGNSYRSQRMFGELHLKNVKVAYSKNGFVWQASEEELIERLKEELDREPIALLKQAEGYRSREPEARQRSAARRALDSAADAIQDAVVQDLPARLDEPPTPPVGQLTALPAHVTVKRLEVTFRQARWAVIVEISEVPDGDWLELADTSALPNSSSDPREITLRMNINNDFMRRFAGGEINDMESLIRVGAAVALAIIVVREQGGRYADAVLLHANQLLKGSLAR
ncbi:MAG: Histidine kinase, gyrase and HSP90-like ATPase [Frankiales bacterium]|nr:Histidine kinase, gyrase and HSP90-like ATPase [Frankiales bacterium]